ncbi:hypothetical protein ACWEN6_34810 [Sphaerisporangium sp. NPDC004334]
MTFADGTRAKAAVASSDPRHDVATLKPAGLPEIVVPATLGGAVAVGAPVARTAAPAWTSPGCAPTTPATTPGTSTGT